MNAILRSPYIRPRIHTVLSDRECAAVELATRHGVDTQRFITSDATDFSDRLDQFFKDDPHDLVMSFYTKLFRGQLLGRLQGRFVNFHPSILPACPGRSGFEDTLQSGSRFVGATTHLIDSGVDTGCPIIQCAIPFDPSLGVAANRHAVFIAQCRMAIQVVHWYEEGRIELCPNRRVTVINARYAAGSYSPNLDFDVAEEFMP